MVITQRDRIRYDCYIVRVNLAASLHYLHTARVSSSTWLRCPCRAAARLPTADSLCLCPHHHRSHLASTLRITCVASIPAALTARFALAPLRAAAPLRSVWTFLTAIPAWDLPPPPTGTAPFVHTAVLLPFSRAILLTRSPRSCIRCLAGLCARHAVCLPACHHSRRTVFSLLPSDFCR